MVNNYGGSVDPELCIYLKPAQLRVSKSDLKLNNFAKSQKISIKRKKSKMRIFGRIDQRVIKLQESIQKIYNML